MLNFVVWTEILTMSICESTNVLIIMIVSDLPLALIIGYLLFQFLLHQYLSYTSLFTGWMTLTKSFNILVIVLGTKTKTFSMACLSDSRPLPSLAVTTPVLLAFVLTPVDFSSNVTCVGQLWPPSGLAQMHLLGAPPPPCTSPALSFSLSIIRETTALSSWKQRLPLGAQHFTDWCRVDAW